eukprot:TRINITY_DN11497_c0_g1_i1.p1 TRINITY_DN11497_c0_g1~~TRINITY_DN11497_c0_g1_i1.p1  ORF type:complete len:223 (+),score=17.42 TRINITY_DN11497_c0_g1_i1:201-869(+)
MMQGAVQAQRAMKPVFAIFAAALLFSFAPLSAASAAPQIIQASAPVQPDETVLIVGDGFGKDCIVELGQLANGTVTAPQTNNAVKVDRWNKISPLQTTSQSIKFVVPKSWPRGVWACRVRQGDAVSSPYILNAPTPWWWNGDGGEFASSGGWVRVFGHSLNFGGQSRALLQAADGSVHMPVSYTHLRAHETRHDLVCRLLLEKKKHCIHQTLNSKASTRIHI